MSNTIKAFGHTIEKMQKTDQLPFNPIVHICLEHWSTSNGGIPRISPQLMTEGEIDAYIEAFKDDLNVAGKQAKAALKRAKASTAKIVSDRNSL